MPGGSESQDSPADAGTAGHAAFQGHPTPVSRCSGYMIIMMMAAAPGLSRPTARSRWSRSRWARAGPGPATCQCHAVVRVPRLLHCQ